MFERRRTWGSHHKKLVESGQMRHKSPNSPPQNQMFEHRGIFTLDSFIPHIPPQLFAHLYKTYIYKTGIIKKKKKIGNISVMGL